jgi:hypothetical protein
MPRACCSDSSLHGVCSSGSESPFRSDCPVCFISPSIEGTGVAHGIFTVDGVPIPAPNLQKARNHWLSDTFPSRRLKVVLT